MIIIFAQHSKPDESQVTRAVFESRLSSCLNSLCFLSCLWHGAKNSCWRASSALILDLGFTVKHLLIRSKNCIGISCRISGFFVLSPHQSRRSFDGKYFGSRSSCSKTIPDKKKQLHKKSLGEKKRHIVKCTIGNDDSRLCTLASSHRASLPLNLAMSLMFLLHTQKD